jgi:hypothetical protein
VSAIREGERPAELTTLLVADSVEVALVWLPKSRRQTPSVKVRLILSLSRDTSNGRQVSLLL